MESKFDRNTWNRFYAVAGPFFFSEVKWKARGLVILLIVFLLSINRLDVLMSYIGRDFMTALAVKDEPRFMTHLYRYLIAFAATTPVIVFYRYTEERLGLMWRRWLSHMILTRYFENQSYYKLNWYGGIDNPDQRIEEDIRSFTASTLSFFLIILRSIITIFAFSTLLWSISPRLVGVVVAYAFIGSVCTYLLGKPLINLNFAQLKKEADYRYKLIKVRDYAESIAFYGGEQKEYTRVRQRLKDALNNLLQIINWNRNLNFFTTGYNYLVTILPTVVVAPLYLNGTIEFGVVSQAGFAFGQVLGALSIIVLNFGSLSAFVAVVTRLGTFWETVEQLHGGPIHTGSSIEVRDGEAVRFKDVTITTPSEEQVLVKNMSFDLKGKSLLITGPSGSGKSSVLRTIAGLWSAGSGEIIRPKLSESMFIPQHPYMILGSLRNQLTYGLRRHSVLQSELDEAIAMAGLTELCKRIGGLDKVLDWANVLATGEQQRLAFARFFLDKTRYVYLDEATTALDTKSEQALYAKLATISQFYISVGLRTSLEKFHDLILELHGDGSWSIDQANAQN